MTRSSLTVTQSSSGERRKRSQKPTANYNSLNLCLGPQCRLLASARDGSPRQYPSAEDSRRAAHFTPSPILLLCQGLQVERHRSELCWLFPCWDPSCQDNARQETRLWIVSSPFVLPDWCKGEWNGQRFCFLELIVALWPFWNNMFSRYAAKVGHHWYTGPLY